MNTIKDAQARERQPHFSSLEQIQQELNKAQSIDDFFGKNGIFARLFAQTLETMLEASLPTPEAARKLLYLTNQNITKKWTMPIQNWANILNQLAIRFEGRFPI